MSKLQEWRKAFDGWREHRELKDFHRELETQLDRDLDKQLGRADAIARAHSAKEPSYQGPDALVDMATGETKYAHLIAVIPDGQKAIYEEAVKRSNDERMYFAEQQSGPVRGATAVYYDGWSHNAHDLFAQTIKEVEREFAPASSWTEPHMAHSVAELREHGKMEPAWVQEASAFRRSGDFGEFSDERRAQMEKAHAPAKEHAKPEAVREFERDDEHEMGM